MAARRYNSQDFIVHDQSPYDGMQAPETYLPADSRRNHQTRPGVPYAGTQSGYSNSMMSDVTSTADYTLSGPNNTSMLNQQHHISNSELTQGKQWGRS